MNFSRTHFATFTIGIIAFAMIAVFTLFPNHAFAATWDELQASIASLNANLNNIPAGNERAAAARLANSWSDTPANRQAWAAMAPENQAAQMATINAFSNPSAAGRTAARTAAGTEAGKSLQATGGLCIPLISFDFVKCLGEPISVWTSSMLLTLGGAILRLAGAIFDFGVNHVIIDFKNTLSGPLITIINNGWTFFRDLSNILIIGIFVFIAISLILGLKEYGQKKLVARVLIIAVLMNFSLLFTKIIIDGSNFMAFAIYSQTAGAGGAQTFSVADKVLAPLHVTGVWDTSALAQKVFDQAGDGAGVLKAFSFGLFGFIILTILAAVILYGAFLIIARAIMLIFLMLTAPIAYATYLAPHFEASEFGWTNWWKSLINNAAFAPLLMMFLSVSILIMQTASPAIKVEDTYGALLTDPAKAVLADGWRVLFVYILGTGLLFTSFRLSSSLAGSISGIKIGQMAAGLPLAFGARGAARLAQLSAGRVAQRVSDKTTDKMNAARDRAVLTNDRKDWAAVEKLRKQKARADSVAGSSFNPMNTALGKALAGSAGLKGALAGEKKGSFAGSMEDRAKNAEDKVKALQLTEANKDAMRKAASEEIQAANNTKLEEATKGLQTAQAELEKAQTEEKAAADPLLVAAAEAAVAKNKVERSPELDTAQREVKIVQEKRTEIQSSHDSNIQNMQKMAEQMSGKAREEQIRAIESRKAEHQTAIKQQDQRITDAKKKVETIEFEISAPLSTLQQRQAKAATELETRKNEAKLAETNFASARKVATAPPDANAVKKLGNQKIEAAERSVKTETSNVAADTAGILGGGQGAHVIQHHFDEKFKTVSNSKRLLDRLEKIEKAEAKSPPPPEAPHA